MNIYAQIVKSVYSVGEKVILITDYKDLEKGTTGVIKEITDAGDLIVDIGGKIRKMDYVSVPFSKLEGVEL